MVAPPFSRIFEDAVHFSKQDAPEPRTQYPKLVDRYGKEVKLSRILRAERAEQERNQVSSMGNYSYPCETSTTVLSGTCRVDTNSVTFMSNSLSYREQFDKVVKEWREGIEIHKKYDSEFSILSKFVNECGKKVSYIGKVYNVGKINGVVERELVDNLAFKYNYRPKLSLIGRNADDNIERIEVTTDDLELLEKI